LLAWLPDPGLEQQELLPGLGLVRPQLPARLPPHCRELLSVPPGVGELDAVVPDLGLPQVPAVVVQARVYLHPLSGRLAVAGERLEVCELFLEVGSEEEASYLDPGVGGQTGVGRPGVEVRVVVAQCVSEVRAVDVMVEPVGVITVALLHVAVVIPSVHRTPVGGRVLGLVPLVNLYDLPHLDGLDGDPVLLLREAVLYSEGAGHQQQRPAVLLEHHIDRLRHQHVPAALF